jgi:hypothetical protein
VISHSSEVRRSRWNHAAETPVLVATLRAANPQEHLAWTQQEGLYYTPLTPSQPRQLNTRVIGFYEPRTAAFPGGVRLTADVQSIEVLQRSSLDTPWKSDRDPKALQVIYRLNQFAHLPAPIFNRTTEGNLQPFRINRWTSLLALKRSSVIPELLLESTSEWAFHEWLGNRGIRFTVRAARRPSARSGAVGRATFITSQGAIRFFDPNRVELQRGGRTSIGTLQSALTEMGLTDPFETPTA